MSELMSQRQFANAVGRSNVWVNRLVKQGKIPVVDGKIPYAEGLRALEESQQLGYDGNREHAEKQRQKSKSKSKSPPTDREINLPGDDAELPNSAGSSSNKVTEMFNRARAAEKTMVAKIRELELKEKQGLLIPKEAVQEDAANTAAEFQALMTAVAPQVAPLCEGKPARIIEQLIQQAISDAFRVFKKSRYAKGSK